MRRVGSKQQRRDSTQRRESVQRRDSKQRRESKQRRQCVISQDADVTEQPCQQPVIIRKQSSRYEAVDPLKIPNVLSADESEYQVQYLTLSLASLFLRPGGLRASPEIPLQPFVILAVERALRRARDTLCGGAPVRLLRCIQRVARTEREAWMQEQLQETFLNHAKGAAQKAPTPLPQNMASPRTEVHWEQRKQHFERIRAECDAIQWLQPAQSLPERRQLGIPPQPSGPAADDLAIMSKALPRFKSQGHSAASSSERKRPGSSSGSVCAMARSTRVFSRDGQREDMIHNVRRPASQGKAFAANAVAEQDVGVLKLLGRKSNLKHSSSEGGQAWASHRRRSAAGSTLGNAIVTRAAEQRQKHNSVFVAAVDLTRAGHYLEKKRETPCPWVAAPYQPADGSFSGRISIGNIAKVKASGNRPHSSSRSRPHSSSGHPDGVQQDGTGRSFAIPGNLAWAEDCTAYEASTTMPSKTPLKERCVPMQSLRSDPRALPDLTPALVRCCTPEVMYARACTRERIHPRLVKFLSAVSSKLDLQGMSCTDQDLEAILDALPLMQMGVGDRPPLTAIDLSDNLALTDDAVARFLEVGICHKDVDPAVSRSVQLKTLRLSGCCHLATHSLSTLSRLLQCELARLEDLNLSGITIPSSWWATLSRGVSGLTSLRHLGLARTACGRYGQDSCLELSKILMSESCHKLESLDISGNHFLHQGCSSIGEALRNACGSLHELDLSHNAGQITATGTGAQLEAKMDTLHQSSCVFNPIMLVLEALGETSLQRVAFANCQLTYEEDCVLEDSVNSSNITSLDVSNNPHGEQGVRCLVRLLMCSSLQYLDIELAREFPTPSEKLIYDHVKPTSQYRLSLDRPHHRAVLRLLLKIAEKATGGRGKEFSCFSQEKLASRNLAEGMKSLCTKRLDRGGDDWQVPSEGSLDFYFQTPPFFTTKDDVKTMLRKFSRGARITVTFPLFTKLVLMYERIRETIDKQVFLNALSWDLSLKLCHLKHIGRVEPKLFPFTVETLLATVDVQSPNMHISDLIEACCKRGSTQMMQVKRATRIFQNFNPEHPDGHYRLDLAKKIDRGVAHKCIAVSRWIKKTSAEKGLIDLSEQGNYDCLRHTTHVQRGFSFDSEDWLLPESGVFEFDIVLPRPKLRALDCIDSVTFEALTQSVQSSACHIPDRLHALRLMAQHVTILPKQLSALIKLFPSRVTRQASLPGVPQEEYKARTEVYVTLYNRTLYHSQVVSPMVLYNQLLLSKREIREIRYRLGWIHTFDVMNMHEEDSNLGNRHGPMDMATRDGWVIVKIMMLVSSQEESPNFFDSSWSEVAAMLERGGYTFIIPASWIDNLPKVGKFMTEFHSKPEEVKYNHRKELAKTWLAWTFPDN